jgi:hypothetical protein
LCTEVRIDVQPNDLLVGGQRGWAEPLSLDPLGEVRIESLLRRLDPLPYFGLADLRAQSGSGVLRGLEAALEDDARCPWP